MSQVGLKYFLDHFRGEQSLYSVIYHVIFNRVYNREFETEKRSRF